MNTCTVRGEAVKLSDLWTKDWHENWKRTFDVQVP